MNLFVSLSLFHPYLKLWRKKNCNGILKYRFYLLEYSRDNHAISALADNCKKHTKRGNDKCFFSDNDFDIFDLVFNI